MKTVTLPINAALNVAANMVNIDDMRYMVEECSKAMVFEQPRPRVSPSDMEQEITRLQKALSDLELSHSEGRIAIAKIEGIRKEIADYPGGISRDSLLGRIKEIANGN